MTNANETEQLQARTLRDLYFTRTVVQLLWAAVVLATAAGNPTLAACLLILYPLWDVACTVYDLKASNRSRSGPPTAQYINAALGVLAAAGIALFVFRSPQEAIVTFGAWAFAAGLAQLAVGVARRSALGGQWAMMLSGLQSAAAGMFFLLGGFHDTVHIKDLGRYAIFGGAYFLIAGILMHRRSAQSSGVEAVASR